MKSLAAAALALGSNGSSLSLWLFSSNTKFDDDHLAFFQQEIDL
jgi:hypothetical protein